jgi:hypothetical protein
LHGR